MMLIQNGTQGPTTPPTKQVASGTPGYAYGGPPGATPSSRWDADIANTILAELVNVVTGAGLSIDPTNDAQVLAAIKALTFGRLLNVQVFTTSGTYTPTAGMSTVIIEAQGGGAAGGGAGGAASGNVSLGAPGTAGSYAKGKFTAAQIGASKAVTVGAGGAGVSNSAGNNGGTTSVGSLIIAPGGIGGGLFNNASAPTANGNGSTSSAPTGGNIFSARGVPGTPSVAFSTAVALSGQGGSSVFGPGSQATQINQVGVAGVNYGTGGSGCVLNNSGGATAGGNGAAGIVIVWEYS